MVLGRCESGRAVHAGQLAALIALSSPADLPTNSNAAYLIGGRLLHPGDSFTVPTVEVEILAAPAAAPWVAVKAGWPVPTDGEPFET